MRTSVEAVDVRLRLEALSFRCPSIYIAVKMEREDFDIAFQIVSFCTGLAHFQIVAEVVLSDTFNFVGLSFHFSTLVCQFSQMVTGFGSHPFWLPNLQNM